jgi:hypothetical protein
LQVLEYNRANREVAILCNHQRTVPKAFTEAWDKLTAREALLEKQVAELREQLALVRVWWREAWREAAGEMHPLPLLCRRLRLTSPPHLAPPPGHRSWRRARAAP